MPKQALQPAVARTLVVLLALAVGHGAAAEPYSPYAGQRHPTRVFRGDTHHHTANSGDAFTVGVRLGPETVYRFARGQEIVSSLGQPARLPRPLDFLAVSDHAALATWRNSIGDPALGAVWRDPDFDPDRPHVCYARVLEIPTPRWTSYDAVRFGLELAPEVPTAIHQRAYTSPIWYMA